MDLPAEQAYLAERAAFVETITSLSDAEFSSAETLCAGWTPRDVLAHQLGIDDEIGTYVRAFGRISVANERIVARYRSRSREDLERRARRWASEPALPSRLAAWQYLGDLAVHHQDVLRPLGRSRDIPEPSRRAILRTGYLFGAGRLTRFRVEPTDIGRPLGRGQPVRGAAEALGMWLAGRAGIEPELTFG